MSKRDKLINKIYSTTKNVRLAEADALLILLGFNVRSTKHSYIYQFKHYIITLNRHNKILHSKAVKELRLILDEILDG